MAQSETFLSELNESRQVYALKWSGVNSEYLARSGLYDWMADSVLGYKRIFEIGTGGGMSTSILLSRGHEVVGIDENPSCLEAARARLSADGYRVALNRRGAVHFDSEGYSIEYGPVELPDNWGPAALIEGNLFEDELLLAWLSSTDKFDAVICWLAGAHKLARLNRTLPLRIRSATAQLHRVQIQEQTYVVSDRILKRDGLVSFVDRGDAPPKNSGHVSQAILEFHTEQADGTSLRPFNVKYKLYREIYLEDGQGIKISRPITESRSETPSDRRSALICVTAVKAETSDPAHGATIIA